MLPESQKLLLSQLNVDRFVVAPLTAGGTALESRSAGIGQSFSLIVPQQQMLPRY